MAYYTWKSYKIKVNPWAIFAALKNERYCFFLDSSLNTAGLGRYSFLGIEPFYILKTRGKSPFTRLREVISRYQIALPKNGFPFLGGAVGYLSYDLGLILEEKVKALPKQGGLAIPDCFFGFYNTALCIDHLKDELHIFCVGFPEAKAHLAKALCERNFKKIYRLLSNVNPRQNFSAAAQSQAPEAPGQLNSNFSREEYLAAVKKAKDYIRRGDIYQVNLSQQFTAKSALSGLEIYRRLRQLSPSSFGSYFDAGEFQILSSSPESFLRLQDGIVTTRPMKGTRPRAKDKRKDSRLRQELLKSAKDRAELTMIVDLERNDLGRVCNYDSVKVTRLRQMEQYNTVFQTTATVCGRLHKNRDRVDLLRACFPGGSITGCPKIRAMEIIEELEPVRRNVYTGCLGYLSFGGDMDFNILIRTILKKENQLYFGVGGGIVADSRPEDEYTETLVKARAMVEAANG
ncbi:MAG: aminodeoxychorismate synthase component I [Candidatus Omnitrophica bacterium]|nr:aminodeoxychorismate synthase component I [Candidatus Omnitrophota bacterium]